MQFVNLVITFESCLLHERKIIDMDYLLNPEVLLAEL